MYDFDNWSQDDEDAALRALNDVRYIIVDGDFVGKFSDGTIVKLPLVLKLSMIEELQALHSESIDQFRELLKMFAGEDAAEQLQERNLISVAIMTEKYFRAMRRAQELAFPQS